MKPIVSLLLAVLLAGCVSTPPSHRVAGPWDLSLIQHPPAVTHGTRTGLVEDLYYEGEPRNGKPTRVFAYLGRPATHSNRKLPAMLLVHGGGGKAFREWAEHWAQRGYIALAMDLSGNGPAGPLPDGMPDQSDQSKFRDFGENEVRDMWSYHAVAAVLRGHALLRALPEVDADRIGVTGISWGGYLTCIIAGIDPDLKVAVPVYGCGFLGDNSYWTDKSLAAMKPEARQLWLKNFDPSQYLAGVRCPTLFLNGTTDFAYPLDSYQKSYRLVREKYRHVDTIVGLPHGHIWTFEEVDAFADSVLRHWKPLANLGAVRRSANVAQVEVKAVVPLKSATLNYTTDSGVWQKRSWSTVPARIEGGSVIAELPAGRPLTAFLAVTDERGLRMSSEHFVVGGN
jgi:dienelactone hydrolase